MSRYGCHFWQKPISVWKLQRLDDGVTFHSQSNPSYNMIIPHTSTVEWHSNWHLVQFPGRNSVLLPTLIPSWGLNCYFTMNFRHKIIVMLKTCVPKFKATRLIQKKDIQDLPTRGSCKKSFTPANFGTLQRNEGMFFSHGIFGVETSYTCEKIQVQKIHKKNDIPNLPTGIVVRNKGENCFTTSNFDSLPRAENLLFQHEIFVTRSLLCW